jgi:hypothetical protein
VGLPPLFFERLCRLMRGGVAQFTNAALPPHSAERLCLSDVYIFLLRLRLNELEA